MVKEFGLIFLFAFAGFLSSLAYSQVYSLTDSLHLPLEVYRGFEGDSITLPGDSIAQPIYTYRIYHSKVKVKLEEVGEVYVHRLVHFEGDQNTIELYSRKPNREFIDGIKRVGNFRLYEHQNYITDSTYSGVPKIEFVEGFNSILRTVYPLSVFKIGVENDFKISGEENDPNHVEVSVKDIKRYVDPILYDSLTNFHNDPPWGFRGWIQYHLEPGTVTINLYLFGWNELGTFESVIYDNLGKQIGHIQDYGAYPRTSLTENHQFLYVNTGGALTEDYIAPYVFRIYDLLSGEAIFTRRSTSTEMGGGTIHHTNFGVFVVKSHLGQYPNQETYVIDHDKNLMYAMHKHPQCQPPCSAIFFPDYFECRMSNGIKNRFKYTDDFESVPFPE